LACSKRHPEWPSRLAEWAGLKRHLADDRAIGTLEIILIVAVIVVLAVAFRKWIIAWVEKLFRDSNDELIDTSNRSVDVPQVP